MTDGTVAEVMHFKHVGLLDDATMADLSSWDDLSAIVAERGIATADISDLGTGFAVVENKSTLVGVEFAILDWRFNKGVQGTFVSVHILTRDGRKLVLNDGGSGVFRQMQDLTSKLAKNGVPNSRAVVRVPKGLRQSDYIVKNSDGEDMAATTFYLSLDKG